MQEKTNRLPLSIGKLKLTFYNKKTICKYLKHIKQCYQKELKIWDEIL